MRESLCYIQDLMLADRDLSLLVTESLLLASAEGSD